METIKLQLPLVITRMSKNSICFEQNGKKYWIHRNVLNSVLDSPDIPTFVQPKTLSNCSSMNWIAVPKTL